MGDFDFADYWKDLAEQDPPVLRARERFLRQCIALHPQQAQELAEFQAHIDATCLLAGSPLQASCVRCSASKTSFDAAQRQTRRTAPGNQRPAGDLLASGQTAWNGQGER